MEKNVLLKQIAEKGYNISYAANLNFATYDIVTGLPPKVSYLSLVISVIALVFPNIDIRCVSVPILLLSIACLYAEKYSKTIDCYRDRGVKNTLQLNELQALYLKVNGDYSGTDFTVEEKRLKQIYDDFCLSSEVDQIMFSSWFAHYKMFYEKDYKWMDEQLHFGFWKDKVPASLKMFLILVAIIGIALLCLNLSFVMNTIASLFKGLVH